MGNSGTKAFGFAMASIMAALGFSMMLIYLLVSITSGLGVDWSTLFNYDNSVLGMGGWFVVVFIITLVLSGAIFVVVVGRRANLKR
jgi:hypothetical protein